jgi:predicted metal-dependent peptidase
MKKLNRKVPYLFPGVKRGTIANFLFAIDQSGSMSNKEVQVGMGELLSLSKEASIDSINFDTEVDLNSLLTWKHGKDHDWVRTRQGGTDVNCVAKYLSKEGVKNKYSGCIIYTDGYTPDLQAIPRVKVLWLITENGTRNPVRPGDLCVQIKHEKKPSK